INSPIKGYSKGGMKKIRAQHKSYGNVAIVNEFDTFKDLPTVRLHGAVECVHPRCPARRIKYTTRGSDTNAAANITLSGASIVLAADFQPLSPFYRNANHTRHNLANELLSVMTPELVPRDFIRDE
ncbi:6246_t:CDS:2, partial [Entrophospora sp. SA101]